MHFLRQNPQSLQIHFLKYYNHELFTIRPMFASLQSSLPLLLHHYVSLCVTTGNCRSAEWRETGRVLTCMCVLIGMQEEAQTGDPLIKTLPSSTTSGQKLLCTL